ncbi:CBS domain-containing protein CBSCBSPB5-like [Bidens hawaiensis]|uniref:CBS domain-containing protein CBSCBSPB5-like n=1 Tax=Bidens hawaiensis TaxID=980011 RepID=UPI00404B713A
MTSESGDTGKSVAYPSTDRPNSFALKIQDKRGRMHRYICDSHSLSDLTTIIIQRLGGEIDRNNIPQILYEDEEEDKVVITSDNDLTAAVEHAQLAGWKGLRLHLDYSGTTNSQSQSRSSAPSVETSQTDAWGYVYSAAAVGVGLVVGLCVLTFLRRSHNRD